MIEYILLKNPINNHFKVQIIIFCGKGSGIKIDLGDARDTNKIGEVNVVRSGAGSEDRKQSCDELKIPSAANSRLASPRRRKTKVDHHQARLITN